MDVFSDHNLQRLLAASAVILSPEAHAVENCLWITGKGKHGDYRQLFVSVVFTDLDEMMLTVTLSNENRGKSTYMKWGHSNFMTEGEVAGICHIMIEALHDGDGEDIVLVN
jgi:hypothetical protein